MLEVAGHPALALHNDHLRAVIIPSLGGRVWTLEDVARRRQWIWHRGDVPLVACQPGADYDTVWAGGWEELFPNDAKGRFEGRDLPDHGEWWTLAWDWTDASDDRSTRLRLTARSRILKADCTKEFILDHGSSSLAVSYRIRSRETEPCHFLFKQHLPIAITPGCRLTLPGGRVEAVDPAFGSFLKSAGQVDWPGPTDLRVIPPRASRSREFIYVRDLPAPWCGIDDVDNRAALRLEYDRGTLPFVWLFLSYGGWGDTYTAVLEPCTNLPKDLATAARLGQSALLPPGAEFVTRATVRLTGID
jgi:hypothetical protein